MTALLCADEIKMSATPKGMEERKKWTYIPWALGSRPTEKRIPAVKKKGNGDEEIKPVHLPPSLL
jgi:hypothetical protein